MTDLQGDAAFPADPVVTLPMPPPVAPPAPPELSPREAALAIAVPFLETRECVNGQVPLTSYHGHADRPNVWTIGVGLTTWQGKPVGPGLTITRAEADAAFAAGLAPRADIVDSFAPPNATPQQRAALYSFIWNEGNTAFRTSALARYWRAGNVAAAATCFAQWVFANGQRVEGLVTRRALERALFLST